MIGYAVKKVLHISLIETMRLCVAISVFCLVAFPVGAKEFDYPYSFFVNSRMANNHFYSAGSHSGNGFVRTIGGKLPVSNKYFHTAGNSLEIKYTNGFEGGWTASVYRQRIRGQDHFKKASHLSFWIFIEQAKLAALPSVQLMKKDSILTVAYPLQNLPVDKWHRVLINASDFGLNNDELFQCTGVVLSQQQNDGEDGLIFIDDVEFADDGNVKQSIETPAITAVTGYARHCDIEWSPVSNESIRFVTIYRSADAVHFDAVGIQWPFTNRYADYTGETGKQYVYKITVSDVNYHESEFSLPVSGSTRVMSDDELLTMVQRASFRYYWEGAERNSGLAKENIAGRHDMIASGASGFGIMAMLVGAERKFITRQALVQRFLQITSFLEKAETFHGAFPHFIDGNTGKVVPFFGQRDNGGDLVETSFLLQGLLAARSYFNQDEASEKLIRDRISNIWENVEWSWYRRYPDSKFLYWHWSPDKEWVINHRLIGWNETMVTYLLAIASPTHSVPAGMYYSGWASQDTIAQQYRSAWGGTKEGSMFSNGNTYYGIKLDVGVSNGGPLFFTHYAFMGYNPHDITDKYTNYFTNNQHISQINYRYCIANPEGHKGYGSDCWGLTACDGPFRYNANEPVPGQDNGIMAPTGAISSFPYTATESMNALKNYYYNYGEFLWGEYGFRDAFSLDENWCSEIYMGLNQAPMVVMIENFRTGLIWKLFMNCGDVQQGLKKLALVSVGEK